MKYEAVAQFSVTGHRVSSVRNLLDGYGIDYVILNSSGTGFLSTITCEIAILKPEPTELTPDRMFSFIMKFDEMVRIGKESHTLTPAQIDFAKSCDKTKLLKFLDDIWYSTKVAYVKVVAMLAQAYAIAYANPDSTSINSNSGQKHNDNGTISPITMEVIIGEIRQKDPNIADKVSTVFGDIPDDVKDALIQGIYRATTSAEDMINAALHAAGCDDNGGDEKNKEE